MTYQIAFQMEPMEKTHPTENHTILMMHEACKRGHDVMHYEPDSVSIIDGIPFAMVQKVEVDVEKSPHYTLLDKPKRMALDGFDVIHIRQDPPFDMGYVTNTYYLELIADKVLVVNQPKAIRDFPEKLFPLYLKHYMPPTLITRDRNEMEVFVHTHQHVVMKPLYDFHGNGVFQLKAGDANTESLMEFAVNRGHDPMMLQPFIPEILTEGNKRVVFFDGEIAGAIVTKPKEGDFRIYRESTDHAYELNAYEKTMCEEIGQLLKQHDILFAGIDVIGKYVTEINITSPGSLQRMKRIYNHAFEADLWNVIETRIQERNSV